MYETLRQKKSMNREIFAQSLGLGGVAKMR